MCVCVCVTRSLSRQHFVAVFIFNNKHIRLVNCFQSEDTLFVGKLRLVNKPDTVPRIHKSCGLIAEQMSPV